MCVHTLQKAYCVVEACGGMSMHAHGAAASKRLNYAHLFLFVCTHMVVPTPHARSSSRSDEIIVIYCSSSPDISTIMTQGAITLVLCEYSSIVYCAA